jgi:hypothetical protein
MVDFSSLGISINQCPKLKRQFSGELLIVGSSKGVWDELDSKYANDGIYYRTPDVMCLNDMIMHFPGKITHAYSNDHYSLGSWIQARRPRYKKDLGENIYPHSCYGAKYTWPWPGHGSSGLNAIYTGLALGYDQITVAGVPLDDSGHYFDPQWKRTNFTKEVPDRDREVKYWQFAINHIFNKKVKSLSNTRSLKWT